MKRNPITLEALEILDAIDRRGSFAKAAEELGKVTSALSYVVQRLEEQLDVTLFQRQGRRSVMTAAGRVLLDDGRGILEASHRLAEKTREVATGWEPSLRIAIESIVDKQIVFEQLQTFLLEHPSMELDISESVLGGGWDALEHDRVDIVIGAPGPVPQQKGFRAVKLGSIEMLPVIGRKHPLAKLANQRESLEKALPQIRRIITHDTTAAQSHTNVARSAGLSDGQKKLYVQNTYQKQAAIEAGLGIGHMSISNIHLSLENKTLLPLDLATTTPGLHYLVWKTSNKGKGLKTLSQLLTKSLSQE
ncbi:MAG: LysR family transcriptional regulator [Cellvibrionaceae bacterium]|nr:LysR family transcriptional regulator [Cellvibrionaceae bacterium]